MYTPANKKRTRSGYLMILAALAATGLLAIRPVSAWIGPTFWLQWWSADGGGEMFSTGGGFELGGTIGQPDANPLVLAGGDFELVGGFWAVACDPCDMNCDGMVNAFDIEPFLELLFDPKAQPCAPCTGDVDGNGEINAFDIEPFLNCLFP